jgi:hypothetical protein
MTDQGYRCTDANMKLTVKEFPKFPHFKLIQRFCPFSLVKFVGPDPPRSSSNEKLLRHPSLLYHFELFAKPDPPDQQHLETEVRSIELDGEILCILMGDTDLAPG